MFVEKLNAIELHKFIKENIDETVKMVDIRDNQNKEGAKIATIYSCSKNGTKDANFVVYNDNKFCISSSSFSSSKTIKDLETSEINSLWHKFLAGKFGQEYFDYMKNEIEITK